MTNDGAVTNYNSHWHFNLLMLQCGNNRPHRITPQPQHGITVMPVLQETSGSHYCSRSPMIMSTYMWRHLWTNSWRTLTNTQFTSDGREHMLLRTGSWHTEVLHDKLSEDPLHSWEESNVWLREKQEKVHDCINTEHIQVDAVLCCMYCLHGLSTNVVLTSNSECPLSLLSE